MDKITKYVDEGNEYQVPKDIPMVFIGNQQFIFYRPVYDKFLNELKKETQERYGDKIEIIEDQNVIKFNVKRTGEETVEVGHPLQEVLYLKVQCSSYLRKALMILVIS